MACFEGGTSLWGNRPSSDRDQLEVLGLDARGAVGVGVVLVPQLLEVAAQGVPPAPSSAPNARLVGS